MWGSYRSSRSGFEYLPYSLKLLADLGANLYCLAILPRRVVVARINGRRRRECKLDLLKIRHLANKSVTTLAQG